MRARSLALLIVVALALGLATACTLAPGTDQAKGPSDAAATPTAYPPPPDDTPADIKAIWEAWNILLNEHVDRGDLDPQKLKEAAIRAMLEVVSDPYTAYLDPDTYRMESQTFSGSLEGIGATITLSDRRLVIVAPLPNTPAEEAGILPGDVILAIDGVGTEGMSLQEAVLRVRGPRDTGVMLLVRHLGELAPVEITIVRGVITLQSVYSNIQDDGIGYIILQSFTDNTNESLTEILKEMKQQGVRGIILDVRNNPGGLVSTTVDVASQFLKEGLVMYEVDGVGKRTDRLVRGDALLPDIPLVILVNSLSGSGSEVLAGALQDHGRALLVGTTTFGKGSVNLLRRLSDGGGLYFTLARWHTPNGRLIEGDGLEPDVQVAGTPGPDGDPQAEKALELLKEQIAREGP